MAKLTQLKLSLQEKLNLLKRLDKEIIKLLKEHKFQDEIKQADSFKERVYSAMAKIDQFSVIAPMPLPPSLTLHVGDAAHAPAAVEPHDH